MPTKRPQKRNSNRNGKKENGGSFSQGGGRTPKIQYYEPTCSGAGEKETLKINVVGKKGKSNGFVWESFFHDFGQHFDIILEAFWHTVMSLSKKSLC